MHELNTGLLEQLGQQGSLEMQAVLSLVEYDRAVAVDDAYVHFFAVVSRQRVHEYGILFGI
jgi:hypothetical protein